MISKSARPWAFVVPCILAGTVACSAPEPAPPAASGAAEGASASEPSLRFIQANGIRMRIAEMGQGPLVILLHGFPESWYSWRHQLPALAKAGYHAVAPDLRGYGQTDKPEPVEAYDIHHLTADVVGVVDALGQKTAVVVGHDWGSMVAWNAALLHPARFTGVVGMSVPYGGRASGSPLEAMKKTYGDDFYYILYFQEPGAAEKEFDADPRGFLSRLYLSPDSPREPPLVTDRKRVAGGWIPRMGAPKGLPDWLTQQDLDYFVQEFTASGFRGGINFYRNFHRNWETTPQLAGVKVPQPAAFIAGERDGVIRGRTAEQLTASMTAATADFRGVTLIPGVGHWVQQEAPEQTNAALIAFLKGLSSN